ncbi:MAG: hypothetical protein LBH47_02740 [Christensenellaceae bacterium]|nr:hypothetical protein [Christensenellaceae bacterium]
MEFLKKNWTKLVYAIIFLVGGVFTIMALTSNAFKAFEYNQDMYNAYLYAFIGFTVYFLGSFVIVLLKMFAKEYAKYGHILVGLVNTVLFIMSMITFGKILSGEFADNLVSALPYVLAPLLIFGLMPLIKGIKKLLVSEVK